MKDLEEVWTSLHEDDNYNIDKVGLVLAFERKNHGGTQDPQTIMKAYNGSGDLAEKYGKVAYEYHEAFRNYNGSTNK